MNQSLQADFHDVLNAVESAGLFVSVCTIAHPLDPNTAGQDGIGQVDLTDFIVDPALMAIPCMLAPLVDFKPNPNYERKSDLQIDEMGEFHVLLDGYYPAISQSDQAQIYSNGADPATAQLLDILAAESDSQRITTRLAVRRYTV